MPAAKAVWLGAEEREFFLNQPVTLRDGAKLSPRPADPKRLLKAASATPAPLRAAYENYAAALPKQEYTTDEQRQLQEAMSRASNAAAGAGLRGILDVLAGEDPVKAGVRATDAMARASNTVAIWRIQRVATERAVKARKDMASSMDGVFADLDKRAGKKDGPGSMTFGLAHFRRQAVLEGTAPAGGLRDAVVRVTLHPKSPKKGEAEAAAKLSASILAALGSKEAATPEAVAEGTRLERAKEAFSETPTTLTLLLPEVKAGATFAVKLCEADRLGLFERIEVRVVTADGGYAKSAVPGREEVAKGLVEATRSKRVAYSIKPGSADRLTAGSVWKGTLEDYHPRHDPVPFQLNVEAVKGETFTGIISEEGRRANRVTGTISKGVIRFSVAGGYPFAGYINGDRIEVAYKTGGFLSATGMVVIERESAGGK